MNGCRRCHAITSSSPPLPGISENTGIATTVQVGTGMREGVAIHTHVDAVILRRRDAVRLALRLVLQAVRS